MSARVLIPAWLGLLLVFAVAPGLDLWVSGLFFDARTGRFPANDSAVLAVLRETIWTAANLSALVALVFGAHALLSTRKTALPPRVWGFVLLMILMGPLLLVNGILKAFWGRARPASVEAFGGTAEFTPPWQIAAECAGNCSFVSGEASAAAALAIILGVFLWRSRLPRRQLIWALVALVVIGAGMRVLKGRHFLSDVSWSILLTVTLANLLWVWLRLPALAPRITPDALRADTVALWRSILVSVGVRK